MNDALHTLLGRLFYYQKVLIFICDTGNINQGFQAKINLSLSHASPEDLANIYLHRETDLKVYPREFLEEQIRTSQWHCIVAKHDKEIVGYALYSTAGMSFVGTKSVVLDLPPRCTYVFKEFVYPAFRNLGVHKAIVDFTFRTVHKLGFDWAFFAINSTNQIAIHNKVKMGSSFAGSAVFIKTRLFNKVIVSGKLKINKSATKGT